MSISHEQHAAISRETQTAIKLIEAGLREMQRLDGANIFYHLPMLLVAAGFERLMKVVICFHAYRETGTYTPQPSFPKGRKGHNLIMLLDRITSQCFDRAYLVEVPAAQHDIDYLKTDARLRTLVSILSNFGQTARYHDLDIVLGARPTTESSDQELARLRLAIVQDHPQWAERLSNPDESDQIYAEIAVALVSAFERFARALARLFTIGELGVEAKRQTGTIAPFLFLRDSELGTRKY